MSTPSHGSNNATGSNKRRRVTFKLDGSGVSTVNFFPSSPVAVTPTPMLAASARKHQQLMMGETCAMVSSPLKEVLMVTGEGQTNVAMLTNTLNESPVAVESKETTPEVADVREETPTVTLQEEATPAAVDFVVESSPSETDRVQEPTPELSVSPVKESGRIEVVEEAAPVVETSNDNAMDVDVDLDVDVEEPVALHVVEEGPVSEDVAMEIQEPTPTPVEPVSEDASSVNTAFVKDLVNELVGYILENTTEKTVEVAETEEVQVEVEKPQEAVVAVAAEPEQPEEPEQEFAQDQETPSESISDSGSSPVTFESISETLHSLRESSRPALKELTTR
jgi:hypothetical protein